MNSTTAVQSVKTIQGAFKIFSLLQATAFLWPQHANISNGTSFDYIIVGAGTAGSVIANRLTEWDNITVLLIEAGGDPPVESLIPGFFPYVKNTDVDWQYPTQNDNYTQQFHKNYGVELTRGKMFGGSSSLNFMCYTRGHYQVYDEWAQITNDSSWNGQNVLPYFKKSETLTDPIILNSIDGTFHGTDGYMKVTKPYNNETIPYLQAFQEAGNDIVTDTNGDHPKGYTEMIFSYFQGIRQSTAYSFLNPILGRKNLFVLKNTLVTKSLFDENKTAIGVEVMFQDNTTMRYLANKEIIVSAGSINTPQLLMLSGIGPADHLKEMNIDVVSDLPVGQTLQDHVFVMSVNANNNYTSPKNPDPREFPGSFFVGYASLNDSQTYPDYQTLNILLNQPSDILTFCSFYFSYIDDICDYLYNKSIDKKVTFSVVTLINPESKGKILLQSTDPKERPLIFNGYYSNDQDLDNHAKYLAHYIKVNETEVFRNSGSQLIIPEVCGCGNTYDHQFWRCYALCMMVSGYHYARSCPMGAVVDSKLNVYGVQRLRIADASIMPKMPGANTMAATIMVAEKAADLIKGDCQKL